MAEKILLVDDEERIRKLLNLYLTREGYEITEAGDGSSRDHNSLIHVAAGQHVLQGVADGSGHLALGITDGHLCRCAGFPVLLPQAHLAPADPPEPRRRCGHLACRRVALLRCCALPASTPARLPRPAGGHGCAAGELHRLFRGGHAAPRGEAAGANRR